MSKTQYRHVSVTPTGVVDGEKSWSLGGDHLDWVAFTARLDLLLIDAADIDTGADDWSEIRDSDPDELTDLVDEALVVIPAPALAGLLGVPRTDIDTALTHLRSTPT